MKPTIKYSLITLFILLVLGYLVFSLYYFSGAEKEVVCKRVEIKLKNDGAQLISQKDIATILEQNDLNPVGKTIKQISTETIESTLLKNPMVKRAECYKTASGEVLIDVFQRTPKFRVVGFESYYIDVDRKCMPAALDYTAYVPVVSGRVTKTMASTKIYDFITFLEENPFWDAQIEQIYVRDDLKIELVPRVGDAIIMLGKLENYAPKLEKLRKLYTNGFNLIGWNRYQTIDLQYKDQIVCTKIGAQPAKPKVVVAEKKDSIIASKL